MWLYLALAFLLSCVFTYLSIGLGCRLGICDRPSERKIHRGLKSRLGGIAFISSAYLVSVLFTKVFVRYTLFTAGLFLIIVEGLLDDMFELHFSQKMIFEFFAAAFIFLSGLGIHTLGFGIELHPAVSFILTIVGVMGVINAVNMIDADGVAGTVAFISFLTFAYLFKWSGNWTLYMVSLLFAVSVLGFLVFNFPPARVFMGDNGSLTLGYILAAFSIFLTQMPGSKVWPIIPVLILSIPIFDTLWVIYRRFKYIYGSYRTLRGVFRNIHMIFYSDNRHLHHLLLARFSPLGVVLIIGLMQLFFSLEAIYLTGKPEIYGWIAALLNFILVGNIHKLWKEKRSLSMASERRESRS